MPTLKPFLDGCRITLIWGDELSSVRTDRRTKERRSRLYGYRNGSFVGEGIYNWQAKKHRRELENGAYRFTKNEQRSFGISEQSWGRDPSYNLNTVQVSFLFVYPATTPSWQRAPTWLSGFKFKFKHRGLTPPRD